MCVFQSGREEDLYWFLSETENETFVAEHYTTKSLMFKPEKSKLRFSATNLKLNGVVTVSLENISSLSVIYLKSIQRILSNFILLKNDLFQWTS